MAQWIVYCLEISSCEFDIITEWDKAGSGQRQRSGKARVPRSSSVYNMKSKQPYNTGKHFVLPLLKASEQHRPTPRHKANNRSLPKIAASCPDQAEEGSILQGYKQPNNDKKSLKQKLKSLYKKKKNHLLLNSIENESSGQEMDEANVTTQFQREIQRNLLIIKKEKESKKSRNPLNKQRYNSPRAAIKSSEEINTVLRHNPRSATEEDVFSKINQIIMNSQSKSALLIENDRNISFSAFVKNQKTNKKITSKHNSRKKIKTEPQEPEEGEQQCLHVPIKHAGNYSEWRKLSIDSVENGRIKYDASSYEMETDRLEKIRSKNDLSLKKYFEGKNYLNRLMNFRDSSSLLPRKL